MAAGAFISVGGLHKSIDGQPVLRGIDLDVMAGETVVLLGRSGGGKSVLLKHLIGLMRPDRGTITIDGQELGPLAERALGPVRRKVGVLFQDGALFDSMDVAQNVAFPLRELGRGRADPGSIADRVHEALDVVGLADQGEKMPIHLSGGMRKRVALARAIITRPKCILYDEPTAGLDPVAANSINHLIRHLQKTYQVTSVVVTHDMGCTEYVADRVAFLDQGRVAFLGTLSELATDASPPLRAFLAGQPSGPQ
jgi:phospholipid/cholesterol/gamma-HCH transport system ATP-binding protein